MNHLPKLSLGSRRTTGTIPTTLSRGVVGAMRSNLPIFSTTPGEQDLSPLALAGNTVHCTSCKDDPHCPHGVRYCTYPPGGQIPLLPIQGGSQTVKECCLPPRPVCGPCECERDCTRYDGTTFTESCRQGGSCCKVRD